jgi:hypothetical protein
VPLEHAHTIKAGTTGRVVLLFAHDEAGCGVTGLRHDAPGARAAAVRAGDASPIEFPLAPARPGEYVPGGFVEVDADLAPGVYQLGIPDAALAEGSESAMVVVVMPGAIIPPVQFHLVAFDPSDPVCIGMEGLRDRNRHEFLRRALPRLTELELDLGREQERRLSARDGTVTEAP